ncbi:MAG: GTP cyclohydrolase II [Bdellovibrionaceae bacterium]|nr:GTP cyclohydrolase II [Pseudobdellovibrionaceae bacterium]
MKIISLLKNLMSKKIKPSVRQIVRVPIEKLEADFITFRNLADGNEHIALGLGDWRNATHPLVRIHSECLTGDVFGSGKCDCGEQLKESIHEIHRVGGLVLYLRQEGRGIGLYNKLDAYALQAKGLDTYEANQKLGLKDDLRDYTVAAQILQALNISSIRLLSNNPDKTSQLRELGINITEEVSTGVYVKPSNRKYLEAKVVKTRHRIGLAHV